MIEFTPLEKGNPVPLYYQLKTKLLKEIQKGTHPNNIPLPPEEKIAAMCGISRTTVRQAINELVTEGWLHRVKAKGTFISNGQIENSIMDCPQKYGISIHWNGKHIRSDVLEAVTMPAPCEPALSLANAANHTISYVLKRVSCDGQPAALFRIYQMNAFGMSPGIHRVRHMLRTIEANAEDMELLNLARCVPLQEVVSTAFNPQGYVIEYSISRCCGSKCRVEVEDLE